MNSNKVVLIMCSGKKNESAQANPRERYKARDLYLSSRIDKSYQYAERSGHKYFILSAKYGIVDPDKSYIPYYNDKASDFDEERKRSWARKVVDTLKNGDSELHIDTCYDLQKTEFIVLASQFYFLPLRKYAPEIKMICPLEHCRSGEILHEINTLIDTLTPESAEQICSNFHMLLHSKPEFILTAGTRNSEMEDKLSNSGLIFLFERGEVFNEVPRITGVISSGGLSIGTKLNKLINTKSIFIRWLQKSLNGSDISVSDYIEKNISYTFLVCKDISECERLKEGLIATLYSSQAFRNSISTNWIGRNKNMTGTIVSKSGLWIEISPSQKNESCLYNKDLLSNFEYNKLQDKFYEILNS